MLYIIIWLIGCVIAHRILRKWSRSESHSGEYTWSKATWVLFFSLFSWVIIFGAGLVYIITLDIWDDKPPKWM